MDIQLPDGSIAQFPDDMDPKEIERVLSEQFPAPQTMAGPEMQEQGAAPAPAPVQDQSYSGSILPFSRNAEGDVSFDSDAGVMGSLKRAVTLPGEAYRGEVDVNSPEGMERAMEFAAVASPLGAAGRATGNAITGSGLRVKTPHVAAPTAQQLKDVGSKSLDAVRKSGAVYEGDDMAGAANAILQRLQSKGFNDTTAKETVSTLQKLTNPQPGQFMDGSDIHSFRSTLGKVGQNLNDPRDSTAAHKATRLLDKFLYKSGKSGNSRKKFLAEELKRGNSNYAAGKRSDLIHGLEYRADLRAAAANSGHNIGNSNRGNVASALLQPKSMSGFNAAEVAALEGVVKGSKTANRTRTIGNRLSAGGSFGAISATGAGGAAGAYLTGGSLEGAALGAMAPHFIGAASRNISNKLTKKAIRKADENIRKRSQLYKDMLKQAPRTTAPIGKDGAAMKGLLLQYLKSKQAEEDKLKQGLLAAEA